MPLCYRASAALLTQADTIQVPGDDSSGEVEPVLIGTPDGKQVCQKPVGRTAWHFEDIEPHWDRLILRSYVTEAGKKVLYQEGPLANPAEKQPGRSGTTTPNAVASLPSSMRTG